MAGRVRKGVSLPRLTRCRSPAPAMRRVGEREILDAPSFPGQVGYPPPMNMDACKGYAAMGYLSSELAFEGGDANRSLVALLVGQASKGHLGLERIGPEGEGGIFSPCCAPRTHVAALLSCGLGP